MVTTAATTLKGFTSTAIEDTTGNALSGVIPWSHEFNKKADRSAGRAIGELTGLNLARLCNIVPTVRILKRSEVRLPPASLNVQAHERLPDRFFAESPFCSRNFIIVSI
jgi:hypothetical protein